MIRRVPNAARLAAVLFPAGVPVADLDTDHLLWASLRRTIKRELDNRLSRMLLSADLAPGGSVTADVVDGQLALTSSALETTAA